ncbi:cohesin subunit SA-2-like [Xyrauchen texanus]|uniref:cohesin subunit SA-2-like n=1 Tax=Xyrauchen texanus TaxID=154827 RepID=UPI002242A850|nr:cohesin subunit SA-2-like [Xyrauchen texanus]
MRAGLRGLYQDQLMQCEFVMTGWHFLALRLLSIPELSRPRDGASEQDRRRELMLARIRALIRLHTESEHVLYLMDSLWDSATALLVDWTGLTSLLLPQTSCQEQAASCGSTNTFGKDVTSRESAIQQRNQLRCYCEKCHHCLSHVEQLIREQAFMCLSDVLIAHNYQLQMWDASAGIPLLYTPDPKPLKALLSFVLEHVFTNPELDTHNIGKIECGECRLEDLNMRRNLLAAYCNMILHSVLEMSMAAEIFKEYVKYYNDFGDIIKVTLTRTRQMDKIESAHTLVLCLQQLYLRLKQEQDRGNTNSSRIQTYSSIKELARCFSFTFGWDQIKSHECLVMIHRDGIEFIFKGLIQQSEKHSPPYISYLTSLSEFSSKLLKPDKKTIYSYLQKFACEQVINISEESWMPHIYYKASLMGMAEGEDAISYISSDTNKQPSLTNRPDQAP